MAIIILDPNSTIDDFFAREARAQEVANAAVKPEQMVEPGDYCICDCNGIRVYSEILDAMQHLLAGRDLASLDEDEREEYDSVRESYEDPAMKFYRFTRTYSRGCRRGELGDRHVSTVICKITRDEFEMAREAGWP